MNDFVPVSKSSTHSPFTSSSKIKSSTKMEGYLDVKQGISSPWQRYFVQANAITLNVFEDRDDSLVLSLMLRQFQVSWQGLYQDRFTFFLKNIENANRDINWICIGTESESVARNWYHYLQSLKERPSIQINGEIDPLGDIPVQESKEEFLLRRGDFLESYETKALKNMENSKTPPRYSTDTDGWRSPERNRNRNGWDENQQYGQRARSPFKFVKEFELPDEAPEWVEGIFQAHIKNNPTWRTPDSVLNESKWETVESQGDKVLIKASKDDSRVFKGKFKFDRASIENVIKALTDIDKKKVWENSIEDIKALFYAPTTKQAVIHQSHKGDGSIHRKREFVFTRYLFQSQNAYFIIEKTLGNEISGKLSKLFSLSSCRGNIDYTIIQVIAQEHSTIVNVLTKMTNGGLITPNQDSKMTLNHLKNIGNIEKIMSPSSSASETDVSFDLVFIPCPENEIKQFVQSEQFVGGKFDIEEDRYWRERSIPKTRGKVVSHKVEKQEDIIKTARSNFLASGGGVGGDNGAFNSEEENLRDEDINEKILSVTKSKSKQKVRQGVLEIDLTDENPRAEQRLTRRIETELDDVAVVEEEDENPQFPPDSIEGLKLLLERVRKGEHIIECIDKRVRTKALTQGQKEAKIPDTNGDFMCAYSWKRDPNGGLEFIDKDIIERQRQVVMWLLKTAGRLLFEGKSLVNMSLPIIISGKETTLHRAAMNCAYAPVFLPIAGDQSDPLEAFKYAITYFFVSHHVGINQEKPFNPILGETYQGFLGGIPVDCEQISHHPPISTVYMKTDKFVVQSNFRLEVVLGGPNSAKGLLLGNFCVKLPRSNSQVYGLYPPAISSGTTMGKRLFYYVDKLRAYDPRHNFYAELLFNPDDKGAVGNLFSRNPVEVDKVTGTIYQLKPEAMAEFANKNPKGDTKWNFQPKEHSARELGKIEGKWTKFLKIDGKAYWKEEDVRPCLLIDKPNKPLPSDSRYREDLIYRKMGDFEQGQIMKEKMEEIQRADKKGRNAKHGGGGGKH